MRTERTGLKAPPLLVVKARADQWKGVEHLASMKSQEEYWLKKLAVKIQAQLDQLPLPPCLVLTPETKLIPVASNTGGWYIELAGFRRDRNGKLQLWLDHYTDASDRQRQLSFCFKTTNVDRLRKLGRAGTRGFADPSVWRPKYQMVDVDDWRLAKALPKSSYNRPLVEIYDKKGDWSFYIVYLRPGPNTDVEPANRLVGRIVLAFRRIAQAIDGLAATELSQARQIVKPPILSRHLRRERSMRLSEDAKIRDGFTCQICGFNFGQAYGERGAGFAESHHIESLSEQPVGKVLTLEDLITVCSNCHQMLHRLGGGASAVEQLRKVVGKRIGICRTESRR